MEGYSLCEDARACSLRASSTPASQRMRTLRLTAQGENPLPMCQKKENRHPKIGVCFLWRRGRDSNPRVVLSTN